MSGKLEWRDFTKCPYCGGKTYGVFVEHFVVYYRCQGCRERTKMLNITVEEKYDTENTSKNKILS